MTVAQYDEWAAVADRFGVHMEQVRRDHVISHLLGAIAADVPSDDLVFFGGTALSRRRVANRRLSVWTGPSVQVQLVSGEGYRWPTEDRDIEQRYSDAPPAQLPTLTAAGFAAAKLGAWMGRHAPRDLYDLWALAERGLIDDEAPEVFTRCGPQARPPARWVFETAPAETAWRRALGHQTRLRITATEALDAVR